MHQVGDQIEVNEAFALRVIYSPKAQKAFRVSDTSCAFTALAKLSVSASVIVRSIVRKAIAMLHTRRRAFLVCHRLNVVDDDCDEDVEQEERREYNE